MQGKAKIRDVVSTDIQERRLRATVVIQKWFRHRQSTISRKTTEKLDEKKLRNPQITEEKREKLEENATVSQENKKKERRKRGFFEKILRILLVF